MNPDISSSYSIKDYGIKLQSALNSIDEISISQLKDEILKRLDGSSTIYLLGNGGSQANAHHIAGDYVKTFSLFGCQLRMNCLGDNICYLTADANDLDSDA